MQADGIIEEVLPPLFDVWKVILRFDLTPCSLRRFPSLYEASSCFYVYDGALHRKRKLRLVEFSTFVYNCHPLHRSRMYQDWREFDPAMHGAASFSSGLSLAAWLCCYFAFKIRDFLCESGFCLYGWCACFPLNIFPDLFHVKDCESHLIVKISQTLPSVDLSGVDLILSYLTVLMHKFSPQTAPIVGTRFWWPSPRCVGSWPNEPSTIDL